MRCKTKLLKIMMITASCMIAGSMFTGCMSSEQKAEASRAEGRAYEILDSFINSTNDLEYDYEISNVKCVTTYSGMFEQNASKFVRADVKSSSTDEGTFSVLVDTDTKNVYSDRDAQCIKDDILDMMNISSNSSEADADGNNTEAKIEIHDKELAGEEITSNANMIRMYDINKPDGTNPESIRNYSDLEFVFVVRTTNPDYPSDIASGILSLKLDTYEALVIACSDITNIKEDARTNQIILTDAGYVIKLSSVDGEQTEDIVKYDVLEFDGFKILYDALLYNVNAMESDTELGSSQAENHSSDIVIDVKVLNNVINNSSDDSALKCEFIVVSDKFESVIYASGDTFSMTKAAMSLFEVLSINSTRYSVVSKEGSELRGLTLACFTEPEDKN